MKTPDELKLKKEDGYLLLIYSIMNAVHTEESLRDFIHQSLVSINTLSKQADATAIEEFISFIDGFKYNNKLQALPGRGGS
ncbi:hypothetical protein M2277_005043 [Paenibacillus sp. LBL]|uniref:hypothetical protein n=1 Tax=Paenibacillus sp. LBL TaxID=2940563 RepID=UPI002472F48B|nr:hypothetical protein [Paenibacillus sp. LBL]MDH6674351.1 hypothetical protein [Paenibacillus sp. LBL]